MAIHRRSTKRVHSPEALNAVKVFCKLSSMGVDGNNIGHHPRLPFISILGAFLFRPIEQKPNIPNESLVYQSWIDLYARPRILSEHWYRKPIRPFQFYGHTNEAKKVTAETDQTRSNKQVCYHRYVRMYRRVLVTSVQKVFHSWNNFCVQKRANGWLMIKCTFALSVRTVKLQRG